MPGCVRSLRHSSCSRFFLFVIKATPGFGKEIPSLTVMHSGPFLVCVSAFPTKMYHMRSALWRLAQQHNVHIITHHPTGFRVLKFFFCIFILKPLKLQRCRVRTGSEQLKHSCFSCSEVPRCSGSGVRMSRWIIAAHQSLLSHVQTCGLAD